MDANTWQSVFKIVIMLFVAAAGSPFTQWIKVGLGKLLGTVIEDRLALALTGAISAIFAVLEMWLSGVLNFGNITLESFPATFFAVFTVATVYYAWLKGSESIFGRGGLLKPAE